MEAYAVDAENKTTDFIPYNADKVINIIKSVFPRSTTELLQRSTGVPMRSVTRWMKGDSRVPPSLVAKMELQSKLSDMLTIEIHAAYARLREQGLTRQAARSAMLEIAHGNFFGEIDKI